MLYAFINKETGEVEDAGDYENEEEALEDFEEWDKPRNRYMICSGLMEQLKDAEQKQIVIYWWNGGTKTLEFKGSYKDFLTNKNIKVITKIKHPITKKDAGTRFKMFIGSSIITFDDFGSVDYVEKFTSAIKLFLTYLGDRTMFIDGYNREYRLNWR